MLNHISKHKFQDMSQLVRLRGKHTAQCTHCAVRTAQIVKLGTPSFKANILESGSNSGPYSAPKRNNATISYDMGRRMPKYLSFFSSIQMTSCCGHN